MSELYLLVTAVAAWQHLPKQEGSHVLQLEGNRAGMAASVCADFAKCKTCERVSRISERLFLATDREFSVYVCVCKSAAGMRACVDQSYRRVAITTSAGNAADEYLSLWLASVVLRTFEAGGGHPPQSSSCDKMQCKHRM